VAQVVTRLGGALPVAIGAGPDWEDTAEQLDDLFLGDAEVWCAGPGARRPAPRRIARRKPERPAAQGCPRMRRRARRSRPRPRLPLACTGGRPARSRRHGSEQVVVLRLGLTVIPTPYDAPAQRPAGCRRRAARGEAEDPRGGRQPYVSAEQHALLDLHFGAPAAPGALLSSGWMHCPGNLCV
jgi:hypothetical protein